MEVRTHSGRYEDGLAAGWLDKTVTIPAAVFKAYRRLRLSELDVMVLLHLLVFRTVDGVEFPTPEQLTGRLSAGPDEVMASLERLVKEGLVEIEQRLDPERDVHYEVYRIEPFFRKIAALEAHETGKDDKAPDRPAGIGSAAAPSAKAADDLFTVFEKEFGRPLSPMECETIVQWLDEDRYPEPLIRAALKEAVFAGKVYFKYIDRILLEWARNRVQTVEQAKEYARRFHGQK
ncbi:MAG: hypothetical protein BLM47_00640 [Candidatus Reconcilbacillus cellulovorans]|uniref:Uncharacterized protein n=1 Tax=Candidatus Reconcilbacillus cellulovorans TaxID=1906605 RepID=A0A2A6E416_9BACL|nr:MAG: hypothetical protein BLM47_00640 [Candidatus Reconcilbacillus cellulovorans]